MSNVDLEWRALEVAYHLEMILTMTISPGWGRPGDINQAQREGDHGAVLLVNIAQRNGWPVRVLPQLVANVKLHWQDEWLREAVGEIRDLRGRLRAKHIAREQTGVPQALDLFKQWSTRWENWFRHNSEAYREKFMTPEATAEMNVLRDRFARVAEPLILLAEELGIDAAALDSFIHKLDGSPSAIDGTRRVLQRLAGRVETDAVNGLMTRRIEEPARGTRVNGSAMQDGDAVDSTGWLTVTAAAKTIDVGTGQISKLCTAGTIECRGEGRARRVNANSLAAYRLQKDAKNGWN